MKRDKRKRKSSHLKAWSAVPEQISADAHGQESQQTAPFQAETLAEMNSPQNVAVLAERADLADDVNVSALKEAPLAYALPADAQLASPQEQPGLEAIRPSTLTITPPVVVLESLGQRLAAAREQRGWSCEETARRLHLPSQIVRSIEADQFERIGYGVYLRGYLSSYARLVDVPLSAVEAVLHEQVKAPDLVASGRISHSRFLFQRYSGSAVYLVLTGFIVVPFVMFAMNLGGDVGARLTPLDVSPQALVVPDSGASEAPKTATAGSSSVPPEASGSAAGSPVAAPNNEAPLMASFAMFPNQPAPAAPPVVAAPAGQVRLSLNEASWVEIVDADGKRLEYGTLPAGTVKSYVSDKPLDVRLGNTVGAKLEVGGQVEDISPYNRGNVAHFKLFASGKAISRSE
jgi:cytoskeleton protein RodZ